MPILEAHKERTVIVNKRSMAAGYAGIDNPLSREWRLRDGRRPHPAPPARGGLRCQHN